MSFNFDLESLRNSLQKARDIIIFLPNNPSVDATASALALYLCLRKNKRVTIGCPTLMRAEFNHLYGIDRVTDKIANRNLVISFAYEKEAIEKVSYNIDKGKFNLVIEPRNGYEPLDINKVSYSHLGMKADLIFVVGAQSLDELKELYQKEKSFFEESFIINISNKKNNNDFGKINLVSKEASCAEILVYLFKQLNLSIDEDAATNLLAAIETETNYFQNSDIGASTFESVAWCLKRGARRNHLKPVELTEEEKTSGENLLKTQTQKTNLTQAKIEDRSFSQEESKEQERQIGDKKKNITPPDWFKPKVFSSSGRLK